MLIIKKENYAKKSENGIGLQAVKLEPSPDSLDNRNWYQVVDSSEPIFCIKWTNTLLLGTVQAAAILIKVSTIHITCECVTVEREKDYLS